jgi:hypothetical protein
MSQGFTGPALQGAPVDMVVDPQLQLSLTVSQLVIAAIITVFVIRRSSRETLPVNLLVLVAGASAALLESLADAMLLIWHPVVGQWTLYSAYGHSVPVWVPIVFYWAFGAQALWMLSSLRRGASTAELWKLYWIFAFTDLLFEAPPLWMNMYAYYGDQPLAWKPFIPLPMYLPFGNAIVPIAVAIAVYLAEGNLELRSRPWLVVPLGLTAMFAALTWYSWPVSITLNSDVPTSVRWLAGLVSIGVSLAFVWLFARVCGASEVKRSEALSASPQVTAGGARAMSDAIATGSAALRKPH